MWVYGDWEIEEVGKENSGEYGSGSREFGSRESGSRESGVWVFGSWEWQLRGVGNRGSGEGKFRGICI